MSNERATCTILTGYGLSLEKVAQGDLQEGHLDKAVFMLNMRRRLECFSNECTSLSRGCRMGLLRCAGKAGNPFQTTQGNRLSCRLGLIPGLGRYPG